MPRYSPVFKFKLLGQCPKLPWQLCHNRYTAQEPSRSPRANSARNSGERTEVSSSRSSSKLPPGSPPSRSSSKLPPDHSLIGRKAVCSRLDGIVANLRSFLASQQAVSTRRSRRDASIQPFHTPQQTVCSRRTRQDANIQPVGRRAPRRTPVVHLRAPA